MKVLSLAFITITLFAVQPAIAQRSLTLQECYSLLEQNYPLIKQKALISESNDLSKQAIRKNYLPQLSLAAQATYQSDVTHVPINVPGMEIPIPNKDQYRATVNLNQLVYDGGALQASEIVQELNSQVQEGQLQVSLHQLKSRVNQWYFNILLLQEKNRLLTLTKENLSSRYQEVKSSVRNGAALPTADDIIYAEILKIDQQILENDADRSTAMDVLSQLIGTTIDSNTTLTKPEIDVETSAKLARPELKLYQTQMHQLDASSSALGKNNTPKVMLFAQGGYGNPGLNMLDNTFQPMFYGGIKLNWNLWDWNAVNLQRQAISVNKKVIENQQEVFELNTHLELTQLQTEMEKVNALIRTDEQIITLRKGIAQTARSQLQQGVITSSEYVTQLTALNEAAITKKTHEVQLLLTKANYNVIQGTGY